jgi:hypothetical protein
MFDEEKPETLPPILVWGKRDPAPSGGVAPSGVYDAPTNTMLAMSGRPQPTKIVTNCSADPYYQDTTSRSQFTTRQAMVSSIPAVAQSKVPVVVLVGYADGGTETWAKDPRYSVPTNYPDIKYGSGIAAPCKAP